MFIKDDQLIFKVRVAFFDDLVFIVQRIINTTRHWYSEAEDATLANSFGKCSHGASSFLDNVLDNGESEAYAFAVLLGSSL